jgi:DNA-binding transcriptional ArsR family regulator
MDAYEGQAKLLKVLANPARLQILEILREDEHCVCHLEAVLGLRQAYVSQQLMLLREAGLVVDRKEGLRVYYRVQDPGIYGILDVARSIVSRQAQKKGLSLRFTLPNKARPHACNCPKCTEEASLALAS